MILATQRRRRGVRGLGQMFPVTDLVSPTLANTPVFSAPPTPPPDATSCSTWDFFMNPAAWSACASAASNAQIQSVVANAQYYYGTNSPAAQAAAQAAAAQEAQSAADAADVSSFYGAGNLNPFFTPGGIDPNDTSTWPWWMWLAIFGGGALLVVAAVK